MQTIRDRIVDFRRVRAGELRRHPLNWRVHPPEQRSALSRVLREIGYADALVARRLPDGALELIDGHLRAATTPDVEVPVLVVDLDEQEAALLLAVHDPLTEMAECDEPTFRALVNHCDVERTSIDSTLRAVHGDVDDDLPEDDDLNDEPRWRESFQVVVDCADEAQQQAVFERLTAEGFSCRVLTL